MRWAALGALRRRDDPGPGGTGRVRRHRPPARRLHGSGATVIRTQRLELARGPDVADRRAGGRHGPGRAGRGRAGRSAGAEGLDSALDAAAAGAGLDLRVPAGVGDRPGRAATGRHHRLHAAAARGACRAGGDPGRAAGAGGAGWAAPRCGSSKCEFTYPGRLRPALSDVDVRGTGGGDGGAGRDPPAPARPPSPTCCCASGTRTRGRSAWMGSTCAT